MHSILVISCSSFSFSSSCSPWLLLVLHPSTLLGLLQSFWLHLSTACSLFGSLFGMALFLYVSVFQKCTANCSLFLMFWSLSMFGKHSLVLWMFCTFLSKIKAPNFRPNNFLKPSISQTAEFETNYS